jgi:nucleotide-binding universal stress UspA family protein
MSASGAKQAWFKVGQSADELGPQAKDDFIILPTPLLQRMFATILTTWKKRPSRCVNDLPASVTHAAAARTKEGHTMEALRDIVVVLDDSARSEIRLNIAVALAQQHDAHLTGLSSLDLLTTTRPVVQPRSNAEADTQPASELLNWGAVRPLDYPEADRQAAEKAERIEAAFRERLRFSGLRGDWEVASGRVSETVTCQCADLVILGQVAPDRLPPRGGRQVIEDILMILGRPILVIPYIGRFETFGTKILVGWNNSREAARAVNDAIPLLAKAASVTILEVDAIGRKPATDDATGAGVVRHLARHGINAQSARTVMASISAPDALLSYAADASADLLVVGGYGHSRLRELILGGVTRELLRHMTLPVLMSH